VPTPRVYRPDLLPALEEIIFKAMAPAPEQRFQSAGELSRALERALQAERLTAGGTQPSPAPDEAEPIRVPIPEKARDSRSLTWPMILVIVLAVLAVATGAYFFFFRGDDPAVAPTAPPGVPMVSANTDVNVRAGPDTAYEVVGVMRQGQNAEAIGVSPDYGWWVISFPAVSAGRGWVSGQFVSATDTGNLPIVQPPSLPTTEPLPTAVPSTTPPPTDEPPAAPTDQPPVEVTEPLPPSPTSDEIGEVVTPPVVETPPAESTPPEEDTGGIGLCGVPALLLLVGLALLTPGARRRD
jgi:uncharacterized protein YraI